MNNQLCTNCDAVVDPICMSCPVCGSLSLVDNPELPCPYCSYSVDGWERLDEHTWHCPECGSQMNDSEFQPWLASVTEAWLEQTDDIDYDE